MDIYSGTDHGMDFHGYVSHNQRVNMIFQARNLHLLRGCSFSSHDVPMWHFPCKPMRFSAAAAEIADKKTIFFSWLVHVTPLHRYTVTIDSKKKYSTNYEMLLDVARCC